MLGKGSGNWGKRERARCSKTIERDRKPKCSSLEGRLWWGEVGPYSSVVRGCQFASDSVGVRFVCRFIDVRLKVRTFVISFFVFSFFARELRVVQPRPSSALSSRNAPLSLLLSINSYRRRDRGTIIAVSHVTRLAFDRYGLERRRKIARARKETPSSMGTRQERREADRDRARER